MLVLHNHTQTKTTPQSENTTEKLSQEMRQTRRREAPEGGAADGGRGALKVFPFTWRPRTFYSSGNKPLIVVYSEKGNHL